MGTVVNENTSVVQIRTSELQSGQAAVVYLSTTATPGQFVTIRDATGFLSSPQQIRVSTTGGATLTTGSTTITLQQGYTYLSLHAKTTSEWSVVNQPTFPDPTAAYSINAADVRALQTSSVYIRDTLSSLYARGGAVYASGTLINNAVQYVSTLYVNDYAAYQTPTPGGFRATLGGGLRIYGSTVVGGSLFANGDIQTGGDLFLGGANVSSKRGVIALGSNLTVFSTIRATRGPSTGILSTQFLTLTGGGGFSTASQFGGTLAIATSATAPTATIVARQVSTSHLSVSTFTTLSSITFGSTATLQVTPSSLQGTANASLTISSSVSNSQLAANALAVSTAVVSTLLPSPSCSSVVFSTAAMWNPSGSISVSSLQGNVLRVSSITAANTTFSALATASELRFPQTALGPPVTLSTPFSTVTLANSDWAISSVASNGTFLAPAIALRSIDTISDEVRSLTTRVNTTTVAYSTCAASTLQLSRDLVTAAGASFSTPFAAIAAPASLISGSQSITASSITTSSFYVAETVSSAAPIRLAPFAVSTAAFSTSIATAAATASSLSFTRGIVAPVASLYSSFHTSTPWMLVTSNTLNDPPFSQTSGLGTPYVPTLYGSIRSSDTVYSLIDPRAQVPSPLSSLYVNTVAGTGTLGASGDGGAASNARLGFIAGQAASDASHNLFFGMYTDATGWTVRKISGQGASPTITTIAGKNRYYNGDGGPETAAALGLRLQVAATPVADAVVITDLSAQRVRHTTPGLRISTIAGTGEIGGTGDGAAPLLATLHNPSAVFVDGSGVTFFTDSANHVVRSISADFSTITSVVGAGTLGIAGSGVSTLTFPAGVVADLSASLFIADTSNNRITKLALGASSMETYAGTGAAGYSGDGGPATAATLRAPRNLAVTAAGDLFIADTANNVVRKVAAATGLITTIAGTGTAGSSGDGGPATAARLNAPEGIAVDSAGTVLYIADTRNHSIRAVNLGTGIINLFAGTPGVAGFTGDTGLAVLAELNTPTSVSLDSLGNKLMISDEGNSRIRYVDLSTLRIRTLAGNGSPFVPGDGSAATAAMFRSIQSIAADSAANLYIVDRGDHRVRKIAAATGLITTVAGTGTAGYNGDGGPATAARLYFPNTIAIDAASNLYITDEYNQRVRKVAAGTNTITTVAGNGSAGYDGTDGLAVSTALNYPRALALDSAANLYFGDTSNFYIRKVNATTNIITNYIGNGYEDPVQAGAPTTTGLGQTTAIAVVPSTQQLYFTEPATSRIWTLNTSSLIAPVSGVSTQAYLGDAAPISTALFSAPTGLTVDTCGNLVICDAGNYRLRRTQTVGYPLLPRYLTLNLTYTNYSTTTGSAIVSLNGNTLKTFSASTGLPDSYSCSNLEITPYPLQTSNPADGGQVPFLRITQANANGYTQLQGSAWLSLVPNQQQTQPPVLDSNAGLQMNFGALRFPSSLNAVTIVNKYNDMSLRTINYTGSLVNSSDPAVKEDVVAADLSLCRVAVESIPLRRYAYSAAYRSTFQIQDTVRLGVLTTEVEPIFPKSVTATSMPAALAGGSGGGSGSSSPSTLNMVDLKQLTAAHLGTTKLLQRLISSLEEEVADLQARLIAAAAAKRARTPTQRNTVLG